MNPLLEKALVYAQANREASLNELFDLLRIPSVSTQPERQADVNAAAHFVADSLRKAGLENVQVIPTPLHPLVYGDWLHAGPDKPTLLIYGHYDVQPAEPVAAWDSPPFTPTIRENYLYARGSSDDKGQTHLNIKAVEAYLQGAGALPLNVKFIIEGEEEIGGPSLEKFIPANKALLQADVALVADTAMISPTQPSIVYGLRGLCAFYLDVTGPDHDLHSGSYGGAVNNPINVLCHLISRLKDEQGQVLVPGFYDRVRPLVAAERALLAQYPRDAAVVETETHAPQAWGEAEFTVNERIGARPTLDVSGIIGGYTGNGLKNIIPQAVHAKLSFRLVPDQDPVEIGQLLHSYVSQIAPPSVRVEVTVQGGAPASVTDFTIPAMQAARQALAQVFGQEPILIREGGSIPVVGLFQQHLGAETIMMGYGLPDDRIHSPNERFYLPHYGKGMEATIRFLAAYGLS
ncbi:MAG: dipeptidase [Chloroflexi bacterium]|nr:dipeptidase [Chloroflexota bacterium]MBP8056386.1 dipeptidase [Chloroflexota bacterium]